MIPRGNQALTKRTPQADTCGFLWARLMLRDRVISFIDGFNLYLDLRKFSQEFVHPVREELVQVFYFSTIANHRIRLLR